MKTLSLLLLFLFFILGTVGTVLAAEGSDASNLLNEIKTAAPTSTGGESSSDYAIFRTEELNNKRLIVPILIGAALITLVIVLIFLTRNGSCNAETIIHGSGLVLIIYATVIIVIIAKTEQQLIAATGILGAIAGYLFGSATKRTTEKGGG